MVGRDSLKVDSVGSTPTPAAAPPWYQDWHESVHWEQFWADWAEWEAVLRYAAGDAALLLSVAWLSSQFAGWIEDGPPPS